MILGPEGPREKYRYLRRHRCLSEAGLREKRAVVAAIRDFLRDNMSHAASDASPAVPPDAPTPIMRLASWAKDNFFQSLPAGDPCCTFCGNRQQP